MITIINHGTRGGYYAHRRLKQDPCDECRAAINEYVREYRARTGLERNREGEAVRRKALARLRDENRDRYDELVAEVWAERAAEKETADVYETGVLEPHRRGLVGRPQGN